LASALAGEEMTKLDDDATDAIGEIANMVAGAAKAKFPTDGATISIPSVVLGRHKVVYPRGVPIIAIPCETSVGRLMVDVALKEVAVTAGV
jgi:chemotaxis protein CheX